MRLLSLALLSLLAAAALSACAHTAASGEATAEASSAEDQASSELKEHHRHHQHGGVTQFIAMSLDTLGTDDAKRPEVEKLQAGLQTCMAPVGEIEKTLMTTFADGIAAGAIDVAKVDSTIVQLNTASTAVHECSAETLTKLHALLSPVERAALAEKVQAHWDVWRQVNHEAEAGGNEKGGRLTELTEDLGLTPEQVEKMSAAIHTALAGHTGGFDPSKADGHVQAFATAFASESFDAKAVTENANAHLATHGSKRMAIFYETVTPLLTPEQRAKLAEHLRQHLTPQPAVSAN